MSWLHFYPRESAMHGAVEFSTPWGYVTLKPPIRSMGRRWPWGICVSPNATPWAATFLAGPDHTPEEKRAARQRRIKWGHGYDTNVHDPLKDIEP